MYLYKNAIFQVSTNGMKYFNITIQINVTQREKCPTISTSICHKYNLFYETDTWSYIQGFKKMYNQVPSQAACVIRPEQFKGKVGIKVLFSM